MNYQVWTKEEYSETWTKIDCGDVEAATRELLKAIRAGREPLLTQELPFSFNVLVGPEPEVEQVQVIQRVPSPKIKEKEEPKSEVTKSKAEPDKMAGGEGNRQV